jgi:hypothetical protein
MNQAVIPAKAGIQSRRVPNARLDPGFSIDPSLPGAPG